MPRHAYEAYGGHRRVRYPSRRGRRHDAIAGGQDLAGKLEEPIKQRKQGGNRRRRRARIEVEKPWFSLFPNL